MNKALIYEYICEIEIKLMGLLAYHQFAGIIVSEIVNNALITLHELPGGLKTDEATAKDLIMQNIRGFFTPVNTAKIIDKFQNWDKRVCYGHRGKRSFDTRTLIEFKLATDSSINQVKKLEESMLNTVKYCSLNNNSKKKWKIRKPQKKKLRLKYSWILVVILALCVFIPAVMIITKAVSDSRSSVNDYEIHKDKGSRYWSSEDTVIKENNSNVEKNIKEIQGSIDIQKYKNGEMPFINWFGKGIYKSNSLSSLTISNQSDLDAVVVLYSENGVIRHCYINNHSSYTMRKLPAVRAIIKVMQGNSWNALKDNGSNFPPGGFEENETYSVSKWSDSFDFMPEKDKYGENYPSYEITLHAVKNGNFRTKSSSENEFFNK